MSENHPREETEEQRQYSRGRLRTWVETKLKQHGQPALDIIPDLQGVDVGLRFKDGAPGHIHRYKGRGTFAGLDIVKVSIFHTEDTLGPSTQYTSKSPGEFTRSDINPVDSGSLSTPEINALGSDRDQGIATFLGSLAAANDQIQNQQAGVDGYPITAQEARDVFERCKTATIVRF